MSKYSARDPHDNRHYDIIWRKSDPWKRGVEGYSGWWDVFLGSRVIGQAIAPIKSTWGWTAVSSVPSTELNGFRLMRGFINRLKATDYLLWAGGIWFQDPDNDEMMLLHMELVEGITAEDIDLIKAVNKALYGRDNVHFSEYSKTLSAIKAWRSFERNAKS